MHALHSTATVEYSTQRSHVSLRRHHLLHDYSSAKSSIVQTTPFALLISMQHSLPMQLVVTDGYPLYRQFTISDYCTSCDWSSLRVDL
jgi:hypothetical protein